MKNTMEFTLFFLKAKKILYPYLNCRSYKLGTKATGNLLKSVHFYCFVFFSWKKELKLDPDSIWHLDLELITDSDPNLQII
jgi:hypothetical protein